MDKLDDFICREHTFDWASNHCGNFAGQWVEINEGKNPLENLRLPNTLGELRDFVNSNGGFVSVVDRALGRNHFGAALAIRGDLVFAPLDLSIGCGGMLGICNGSTAIFLREGSGLVTLRMRVASCAWRVNQ